MKKTTHSRPHQSPVVSANLKVRDYCIFLFLSLVASFILFGRSIPGPFMYDDVIYEGRKELHYLSALVHDIWVTPTTESHARNEGFRPLSMATYVVQFSFGASPRGFHIFNVVLHAFACLTIFFLTQMLFRNRMLTWCVSLLFLFVPIHSESVSAIKYREDILSMIFLLWSWMSFLHAGRVKKKRLFWYIISSFLFLCCVLSKELLLFSPVFIYLVADRYSEEEQLMSRRAWWWRRTWTVGLVYGVGLSLYLGLRLYVYGMNGLDTSFTQPVFNPLADTPIYTRVATTGKIYFTYIYKTYFPFHLNLNYAYNHFPVVTAIFRSPESMMGYVLFFLMIWFAYRYRGSPLGVGSLVFLVSYVILSKLVLQSADILAERWMYFPAYGLVLPMADFLIRANKRVPYLVIPLFTALLIWWAVVDMQRSYLWSSILTLYETMAKESPDSAWSRFSLGNVYLQNGKVDDAYRQAIIANSISPGMYEAVELLGETAGYRKDFKSAQKYFEMAIQLNPQHSVPRLNYALTLSKQGKYIESIQYVSEQFIKHPKDKKLRYVMAINYYKMGMYDKAKYFFDWDMDKTFEQKIKLLEEF